MCGHSAMSAVQQTVQVALRTRSFTSSTAVTSSSSNAGAEVGVGPEWLLILEDRVGGSDEQISIIVDDIDFYGNIDGIDM